jgi:hypothetical protein
MKIASSCRHDMVHPHLENGEEAFQMQTVAENI